MLTTVSSIALTQAKPTKETMSNIQFFLDYAATHQDAIITYRASDMVLDVHSNASYLINFTCRYAFLTKAYNQNSTHSSVVDYLPEVKSEFLNMCKGTYSVIPVAVFIMTLYNACFMFQQDKTENLMIKALERFDLTPNIDDNAFF
jgi:hypothetical protein